MSINIYYSGIDDMDKGHIGLLYTKDQKNHFIYATDPLVLGMRIASYWSQVTAFDLTGFFYNGKQLSDLLKTCVPEYHSIGTKFC